MRLPVLLLTLAATLALPAPPARAGDSVRCAGGLVSEGDTRLDLLGKCGEPALTERRVEERAVALDGRDAGVLRAGGAVIEEWTYDFGPMSFMERVTLVNGRVRAVERLGYGHDRDARAAPVRMARASCTDLAGIHEGDGKLDVLARCGEPALSDAWEEVRSVVARDRREGVTVAQSTTVRMETWTYDLGRNRIVQYVTFENGRVVKIRSGSYGYAD